MGLVHSSQIMKEGHTGFIHLKWLRIFEFPKIWKIALRIFQIFEKPFSNFEFCLEKYVKQYLDAYIFWGNSTSHSQLISIYHQFINRNARFPQKSQASNIDLQWSNSIIGKFEDGSSKISKIGRGIFQIFEYSKNSKKTNEWCLGVLSPSLPFTVQKLK